MREALLTFTEKNAVFKTKVQRGGRISIPEAERDVLGIDEGARARILQREWGDSLESRLNYHKMLRENKIIVIRQYLDTLWTDYTEKVDEITQDFQIKAGIDVYSVNSDVLDAAQLDIYNQFYQDYVEVTFSFIGILQGLINVIFFAFESSCKIISTFGCYDFTAQFARNKIIQHELRARARAE